MTMSLKEMRAPSSSSLNCCRSSVARAMSTSAVRKKCGIGPRDSTSRRAIVLRIWVSGTSTKSSPRTSGMGAGAVAVPAAKAASMSRLTILPRGPDPTTASKRRPASRARRRATGDALSRPPSLRASAAGAAGASGRTTGGADCWVTGGVVGGGSGTAGEGGVAVGAAVRASTSSSSVAGDAVEAGAAAATSSDTSSSVAAITAITSPTGAACPSLSRMARNTPSPRATSSMVALSVSISASRSPAATWSPSALSHLTTCPSSMVGERASMCTLVAID